VSEERLRTHRPSCLKTPGVDLFITLDDRDGIDDVGGGCTVHRDRL
jgi:hypothetical protein